LRKGSYEWKGSVRCVSDKNDFAGLTPPGIEEGKISQIPFKTILDLFEDADEEWIPICEIANHFLEVSGFIPAILNCDTRVNHHEIVFRCVLNGISHQMSAGSDPATGDGFLDEMGQIGFFQEEFSRDSGSISTFAVSARADRLVNAVGADNGFNSVGANDEIGFESLAAFQSDRGNGFVDGNDPRLDSNFTTIFDGGVMQEVVVIRSVNEPIWSTVNLRHFGIERCNTENFAILFY
jgi:hypothetical protein